MSEKIMHTLLNLRGGHVLTELERELSSLVKEVRNTGKCGNVNLKLSVQMAGFFRKRNEN